MHVVRRGTLRSIWTYNHISWRSFLIHDELQVRSPHIDHLRSIDHPDESGLAKTFHDGVCDIKRKLLYRFLSYVRMNGDSYLRQSLNPQTLPSLWRSAEQASCPLFILIRVVQDGDQLLISIRRYLHSTFSAFVAGLHISF